MEKVVFELCKENAKHLEPLWKTIDSYECRKGGIICDISHATRGITAMVFSADKYLKLQAFIKELIDET